MTLIKISENIKKHHPVRIYEAILESAKNVSRTLKSRDDVSPKERAFLFYRYNRNYKNNKLKCKYSINMRVRLYNLLFIE